MVKLNKKQRILVGVACVLAAVIIAGWAIFDAKQIYSRNDTPFYNVSLSKLDAQYKQLNIEGFVFADQYAGQVDDYDVQVMWGDGSSTETSQLVAARVDTQGKEFSGVWSNSHTYAEPGNYTVVAYLYRRDPYWKARSEQMGATGGISVWVPEGTPLPTP